MSNLGLTGHHGPFLVSCHALQVRGEFSQDQNIFPEVNLADQVEQQVFGCQLVPQHAGGEDGEQLHIGHLLQGREGAGGWKEWVVVSKM